MTRSASGKVIAITGAGDGLGRAFARRFAAEGHSVVLLGRTLSKLRAVADELGEPSLALACDVADEESVRAAFAALAERHAHIDVLINNAAIYEPFALAEALAATLVNQAMINLVGPVLCSREALPLLRGGGHIVNVSSESVELKMPLMSFYTATKAGLEIMSGMWSRELEAEGVRVTVVRAGAMMDETKGPPDWPGDVARRFAEENAKAGIDLRARPTSHYDSIAEVISHVIATPADVNMGLVTLSASRR